MLNRNSFQFQELRARGREWGIGALVIFFNIYFFKQKSKTNVARLLLSMKSGL